MGLGWTYHQVLEFGSHFLDKGFCFLRCLKSQYHAVENHMHKCDSVFMIPRLLWSSSVPGQLQARISKEVALSFLAQQAKLGIRPKPEELGRRLS